MRNRVLIFGAALAIAGSARAATINVDGSLDAGYGSALAVQTINTGFGDSTIGDGSSGGGSELDAAYGVIQGGNLYLLLTGNLEQNYNHMNIWIADGRAGQSTVNINSGNLNVTTGSTFSPGFQATYALDINGGSGTDYVDQYDLTSSPGVHNYLGSFNPNNSLANAIGGGVVISLNNTNAAGVNGNSGTAADSSAALAVTTGMEICIPLSALGNPTGPIMVLADINGGGNSYLSNQFLAGLPVGTGDLGNGGVFNFGSTSGQYFTVSVPTPSAAGAVLVGLAAMAGLRKLNWV